MKSKTRRGLLVLIATLTGAVALGGCGGSGTGNSGGVPFGQIVYGTDVTPTNGPMQPTGMYTLGRSFVRMNGNLPTEVGFELTNDGIINQPPTPISFDQPNIYIVPLPAQFTQGMSSPIPFKAMAVFYFTGHPADTNPSSPDYLPNGEPQHFHIVFLVDPPRPPDPPAFAAEATPAVPAEDPAGAPEAQPPTVVPGFGLVYDNASLPVGQPPRTTIGQNFLYYRGHMNGIVVGEDVIYLLNLGSESGSILQPQIYPAPGYFPQQLNVRYDPVRKTHIFSVSNFKPVGNAYITQTF